MSDRSTLIAIAFVEEYGFSPLGMFCQMTGKQIGTTTDEEFESLIDSFKPGDDDDSIIDDIATRIFASMRPSLHWNKMREDSLDKMRRRAPVDTLAYLLNRLFAPRNTLKIGVDQMLGLHHDRIRLHKRLSEWGMNDTTNSILYLLLEVDAKLNLNSESAPFTARDFLDDFKGFALLLEMVQAWHARRVASTQSNSMSAMQQANWTKGNTLARPAFFNIWLRSKPPTPSGIKAAAKAEERKFMLGVLAEVLGLRQPRASKRRRLLSRARFCHPPKCRLVSAGGSDARDSAPPRRRLNRLCV
jgi:hypothetical protein